MTCNMVGKKAGSALFQASSIAIALSALSVPLAAQRPVTAAGVVVGFAIDSVRGRALSQAIIQVAGTSHSAIADASGRFRMADLPPGSYELEAFHPFLDTLGIRLRTRTFQSSASDSIFVVISTPSASSLVERKCTPAERKLGSSMAIGMVFDAETGQPSTGAVVSIEWTDYQVDRKSIARTPQKRTTTVLSDGSYELCGIPSDLETGIAASRGSDTTAALRANFSSGIAIVPFRLSPPGGVTEGAGGRNSGSPVSRRVKRGIGVVRGRILDAANAPIAGARVSSEDDGAVTLSGADGSFGLGGLRPGTRGVVVRRLGFEPVRVPVEVESGAGRLVEVKLTKFIPVLETVRVSALREHGLQQVGFASRKTLGAGRYLSPDEIARRNPPRLTDLLRIIPSFRIGTTSSGQPYVTGRLGDCVRYYVDGHLWADAGGTPDDFVSGAELGALEVYGAQSSPPEFTAFGRNGKPCASVVIWTKWKLRI
ncbi:MAG: carboxypeptidase-like regulatory domain-containing protein [Gemmatimonadaceae bacterium]